MKYLRPLTLLVMAVSAAFAQNGGGGGAVTGAFTQTRNTAGRISGSASFSGQAFLPPGVTGAPYSAEQIQEHVQTLNDGTHITQTQFRIKTYRDSQGRTRTERPMFMGSSEPDSPMVVQISDPVAGVQYTLDPQNKVAHRSVARTPAQGIVAPNGASVSFSPGLVSVPPPPPPPAAAAGVYSQTITSSRVQGVAGSGIPPLSRNFAEEKLPPQTIEGVLAEGVRRTTTIPTGAQGNDRPFNIVSETWTAPDLKLMVLSKNDDPRSGESVTKLMNISRNEPDPTLFQPPADYQIVDETGTFTMRYGQQ
jgi:hypothetical protein